MSPRLLFFVASHFALPQKESGPVPFPRKDAWPPGRRLAAGVLSPSRFFTLRLFARFVCGRPCGEKRPRWGGALRARTAWARP